MSFTGLGQPNGLSTLDSSGNVPANQLGNAVSGLALMSGLPNLLNPSNQTFIRNSFAYDDNLNQYGINVLRTKRGRFGQGVFIEEASANLVYNSDFETVTGTATTFNDNLTSYTGTLSTVGSTTGPWTLQKGSVTFGTNGVTCSGTNPGVEAGAILSAGNNLWKPLTGSGGQNLPVTVQASFTTPSSLTGIRVVGHVDLNVDVNNKYRVEFTTSGTLYLTKVVNGSATDITSTTQTPSTSHSYTITLSLDTNGNLTGKLYDGIGTGGTLLKTLTATDTSLTGGFSIGIGGDTGVVITNATVTAPFPNGWTIGGDTRVAWGLTTNAISGNYSMNAVGFSKGLQGFITLVSLPASANTTYTLSAYANSVNAGQTYGGYFEVDFYNGSTYVGRILSNSIYGTNQTSRYVSTNTSPANTTLMNISCVVKDTGTYVFDAIQIEQKPYATTYIRNDSTTTTATRDTDLLFYKLNQPLPNRWFGALVWRPLLNSSQFQGRSNDAVVLFATSAYWVRHIVVYEPSTGRFYFMKYDGTNWYTNYSTPFTFNAGDTIYLFFEDDPVVTQQITLWIGINGGPLQKFTLTDTHQFTDAQFVYIGTNLGNPEYEPNGIIDFPIISDIIPTDAQVQSLYQAGDWGGLRNNWPGISNLSLVRNFSIKNIKNSIMLEALSSSINLFGPLPHFIAHNCYPDNMSTWYRYNPNKEASGLAVNPYDLRQLLFYAVGPGNGPINSWDYIAKIAQVLSGGYKIQSGQTNITTTSSGTTTQLNITFPLAFTSVPYVFVSVVYATNMSQFINIDAQSASTTGFTLQASTGVAQGLTIVWLAIGS